MNLSKKLRIARERVGLSQFQASELTGINYKTLNNYENGVSKPDVGKLAVICRTYKISADYFIQYETEETEKTSSPVKVKMEVPDKDKILLNYFHQLNEEGRQFALDYMDGLVCNLKYIKRDVPEILHNDPSGHVL